MYKFFLDEVIKDSLSIDSYQCSISDRTALYFCSNYEHFT